MVLKVKRVDYTHKKQHYSFRIEYEDLKNYLLNRHDPRITQIQNWLKQSGIVHKLSANAVYIEYEKDVSIFLLRWA